jgi:tetratricopeptide (TPR) repeat protein
VLGESLDADQVIYGMFEVVPPEDGGKGRGTLRITAQILDLKKMSRGPEYMELGPLEDLAKLQTLLAWQTLQFVIPNKAPSQQEFLNRQPAVRVEALENYVRGLQATNADQKLALYTQAVRLDPKYSQANYHLGHLLWQKKNYKTAADHLQRVGPADDHFREANFFLGLCRYYLGDFAGAQSAFELVARDVPVNEVLNNLGAAQSRRNIPSALDNFQKAMDGDPADPDYQFNVGLALFKQGNLTSAADRFRAVLERIPDDAVAMKMLGRCLRGGQPRAAERLEALERIKTTYSESAYWQLKNLLEPKK